MNDKSVLIEAIKRWRQMGCSDELILTTAYRIREEQKGDTIFAINNTEKGT
ncbi:hypothetical protein ACFQ4J_06550 [Laceyella tengchongensis]|jgi:hypothetical protein